MTCIHRWGVRLRYAYRYAYRYVYGLDSRTGTYRRTGFACRPRMGPHPYMAIFSGFVWTSKHKPWTSKLGGKIPCQKSVAMEKLQFLGTPLTDFGDFWMDRKLSMRRISSNEVTSLWGFDRSSVHMRHMTRALGTSRRGGLQPRD